MESNDRMEAIDLVMVFIGWVPGAHLFHSDVEGIFAVPIVKCGGCGVATAMNYLGRFAGSPHWAVLLNTKSPAKPVWLCPRCAGTRPTYMKPVE